ncbi:MAG TPA: hypothetical protein DCP31_33620 [Cyanobacteria bacterium UBA8543]|nr:hypothetical protein [Cyanobacteria bacterium UBA8543]
MATLNVAGLSLTLEPTPAGPLLSTDDIEVEPIAWVVDSIVTCVSEQRFAHLVDHLERGEEIFTQGWSISRPDDPLEDYTEAKENWQKLTNSEPGEDSYVVSTSFLRKQIIVPRKALLEIIYALKTLRQQGTSIDSPQESVDRKSPHNQNNQELTDNHLGKELELDNVPVDDDFLRQMEERAVVLAALEQGEQTLETAATASAKRRFLLIELDDAGLLNESRFEELHQLLVQLQLPMLIAYHQAAMELHAYFRSPQRKRYLPDAEPESILHGSISLDWFRLQVPTPEPYHPYDWLGWCESIFVEKNNLTGGAGDVYIHQGKLRCWLHWRKDDGVTPMLLSAVRL